MDNTCTVESKGVGSTRMCCSEKSSMKGLVNMSNWKSKTNCKERLDLVGLCACTFFPLIIFVIYKVHGLNINPRQNSDPSTQRQQDFSDLFF